MNFDAVHLYWVALADECRHPSARFRHRNVFF